MDNRGLGADATGLILANATNVANLNRNVNAIDPVRIVRMRSTMLERIGTR